MYLTVRKVTKKYGRFTALDNVSISIEQGEFVTIMGPSGAGKSTLLRCLNYLNVPTSGQIAVDGVGVLNGNCKLLRSHRH